MGKKYLKNQGMVQNVLPYWYQININIFKIYII